MTTQTANAEILNLLTSYNSTTLWDMVKASNLLPGSKKLPKEQLISFMQKEFFTQKRVQNSLAHLNERERAVLNRLRLRGDTVATQTFKRELLRAGLTTETPEPTPSSSYYVSYENTYEGQPRQNSAVFEDIIARLTYYGLVFSAEPAAATTGGTPAKLQFHPAATLYIPTIIRPYLPTPKPVIQPVTQQPTHSQTADPLLFLRDLYLYWDFVRRAPIPLVQGGTIGKRSLKSINEILLQPDPLLEGARRENDTQHLFLLRLLLEALNLTRKWEGQVQLIGKDSATVAPFWHKQTAEQVKQCVAVWSQLSDWGELTGEGSGYNPRYPQARQLLLQELKKLETSDWVERSEIVGQLQDQNEDFLFAGHQHLTNPRNYSYYIGGIYVYSNKAEILKKLNQWEDEFVGQSIGRFLYSLGLVELGYHNPNTPAHAWHTFRFTPLGRQVLGTTSPSSTAPDSGKLVIQPNFQLLAIGPVSLAVLAQCDRIAHRQKTDRGVFEYHLSRDSVYAAQQNGWAVSDIIEWLTETSGQPLPQNVRRSLEEWGAHHERIVFRVHTHLLQAATPHLLQKLVQETPAGKVLTPVEGTAVALIKQGKVQPLRAALLSQGILPAVTGTAPEAVEQTVTVAENGRIHPLQTVPTLHLHRHLSQIAEVQPDGTWQLTAESVQRAGGSRPKLQHLLDELHRLSRGPLPESLINQVKTWGGYYGTASIQTLTLIEFEDSDTLAELLHHPDLRPFLTPYPAGNRALATLPTEKLPQVTQHLAQLGIKTHHRQ